MADLSNSALVEKVVKGCIKGDRKSQQLLYKSFYGKMLVVCMRYSRDHSEAQDLLHDGFIKVFSHLKTYEYKGSLEGWVRRIIVNNAIDYIRNKKDFLVEYDDETQYEYVPDEYLDEKESMDMQQLQAEEILALIQELSPAYQTVFNMYVMEDYSHQEIADILNISVGTSKSNLAKAKQRLKELFIKKFESAERL
jgi:RNA polymerase sigma-70 factor (ECF subfamily)